MLCLCRMHPKHPSGPFWPCAGPLETQAWLPASFLSTLREPTFDGKLTNGRKQIIAVLLKEFCSGI